MKRYFYQMENGIAKNIRWAKDSWPVPSDTFEGVATELPTQPELSDPLLFQQHIEKKEKAKQQPNIKDLISILAKKGVVISDNELEQAASKRLGNGSV